MISAFPEAALTQAGIWSPGLKCFAPVSLKGQRDFRPHIGVTGKPFLSLHPIYKIHRWENESLGSHGGGEEACLRPLPSLQDQQKCSPHTITSTHSHLTLTRLLTQPSRPVLSPSQEITLTLKRTLWTKGVWQCFIYNNVKWGRGRCLNV